MCYCAGMTKATSPGLWRRFWYDSNGRLSIFEAPNPPIIVWFVCLALGWVLPAGDIADVVSFVGRVALIVWALMELFWGNAYFRRLFGLGILGLMLLNDLL